MNKNIKNRNALKQEFDRTIAVDKETSLQIMLDVFEFRVAKKEISDELAQLLNPKRFVPLFYVLAIGLLITTFGLCLLSPPWAWVIIAAVAVGLGIMLIKEYKLFLDKSHDAKFYDDLIRQAGPTEAKRLYDEFLKTNKK